MSYLHSEIGFDMVIYDILEVLLNQYPMKYYEDQYEIIKNYHNYQK